MKIDDRGLVPVSLTLDVVIAVLRARRSSTTGRIHLFGFWSAPNVGMSRSASISRPGFQVSHCFVSQTAKSSAVRSICRELPALYKLITPLYPEMAPFGVASGSNGFFWPQVDTTENSLSYTSTSSGCFVSCGGLLSL